MPIPTDQEIMRELEAAANAGSDPKKEAAVKQLDANPVHAFMADLPSTVPYTLIDGALCRAVYRLRTLLRLPAERCDQGAIAR